jgi:hydrogenase maturation protease
VDSEAEIKNYDKGSTGCQARRARERFMTANSEDVRVIGIGNVLMRDDAVGPYLIKLLKARCVVPEQVALVDGGTAGLALFGLMDGCKTVLIVDTVHSGAHPGTVHRYDREALLRAPSTHALTPHDPGLRDALLLFDLTGSNMPDLVLIGVVPERVDPGIGLSLSVQEAMPALLDVLVTELARLGVPMPWREEPLTPDFWWERLP